MEREQIKDVMRDIFGRDFPMKDLGEWVSMPCVLAPWTHEKGHDSSPSAGIKVADHDTSIYNCLAGDTLVRTLAGYRCIDSLAGKTVTIQAPTGEWVDAPFRAYGIQKLYAVNLSRNGRTMTVRATAGHRWFAQSAGGGKHVECTTTQLQAKQRMLSVSTQLRDDWTMDELGFLHGAVFGDGSSGSRGNHLRLSLFGPKKHLFSRLRLMCANAGRESNEHYWVSGQMQHLKQLPSRDRDDSYLLGFISGWIATDGCVDARGNVSLASSVRENLVWLEDVLPRLGIETFGVSGQFRKGYNSYGTYIYTLRFVGSTLAPCMLARPDHRDRFEGRKQSYERLQWQVVSVEETNRVDTVYCAEVPVHAAFVLKGGLVTGNCFTCKNPQPLGRMLQEYSDFSGEDLTDLIEEINEGEFLGPREVLSYETLKQRKVQEVAMPIDEGIYMDLYDSAANHPYLRGRGVSPETARKLELLYDPDDQGVPRILFPVRGPEGELYGFSGRAVVDATLKVKDYHGLAKSQCLLGSHLAGTAKRIVIVEGLLDYAMCHEMGEAGCAVMHSTFTDYQAAIVKALRRPTFEMMDNDKAGIAGGELIRQKLAGQVPLFKTHYPRIQVEDKSEQGWHWLNDPGEMLREEFQEMLAKATLL